VVVWLKTLITSNQAVCCVLLIYWNDLFHAIATCDIGSHSIFRSVFSLCVFFIKCVCSSSEPSCIVNDIELRTPRSNIRELAMAMLQIEQMVEPKYLNPPLGMHAWIIHFS